jgi:hypothetical protein
MRALSARLAVLLAAAALLAGCSGGGGGGGNSAADDLAECLNGQGYSVTAAGDSVTGTSPGGAEFTATLEDDKLTIDDSASLAGTGLSGQERTAIELCTDDRFRPAAG